MKYAMRIIVLVLLCASVFGVNADDDSSERSEHYRPDFEVFRWEAIRSTNFFDPFMWEPRAGLQAVELHDHLFVIGGRKPIVVPGVPFASEIFGDVWVSGDGGASWTELIADAEAAGLWRNRAYFEAVTHKGRVCIMGGQNYSPFGSEFFNDVWCSRNGWKWKERTDAAPWMERAGLGAASFRGKLWVMAGSKNDDEDISGFGRIFFNDVWYSKNSGRTWKRATANAPWEPRAGGVVIAKGRYLYLLGGEKGFDNPNEYFNDVWRTRNGRDWELMTDSAPWSPRPGHKCSVVSDYIVCTGGFGVPFNPSDVWVSRDGADWELVNLTPWNNSPQPPPSCSPPAPPPPDPLICDNIRYDFDMLTRDLSDGTDDDSDSDSDSGDSRGMPKFEILTFGGDREVFFVPPGFPISLPEYNQFRVENDVWRFGPTE
jgi:N-acetylneuraminic acid mutarotase